MSEQLTSIPAETDIVSFDLWLTLIKSDGRIFKTARNEMLRETFASDASHETFDAMVRQQDSMADKIAEERGQDVLFAERVSMIAEQAGQPAPSKATLDGLYERQTELLMRTPPVLLDPETPSLLSELAENRELAIISNTGFIHGAEMRMVLGRIGILDFFTYRVFSNEVGYAKPHPIIFDALLSQTTTTPDHITHIGDNPRADVFGAEQAGMHAIQLIDDVNLASIVRSSREQH